MTDYKKYMNALRKCAEEHENDRTSFGHIIVSDLCRDTANLLESLEQEPTAKENLVVEDCISRQAVLAIAGDSCLDLDSYEDTKEFCDEIKELPPVIPYQKTLHEKTGYWTKDSHCSCCGKMAAFHIGRCAGDACTEIYHSDYCPKCGARMLPTDLKKERI